MRAETSHSSTIFLLFYIFLYLHFFSSLYRGRIDFLIHVSKAKICETLVVCMKNESLRHKSHEMWRELDTLWKQKSLKVNFVIDFKYFQVRTLHISRYGCRYKIEGEKYPGGSFRQKNSIIVVFKFSFFWKSIISLCNDF